MECNKEEALRAKGIAEKKMGNKDYLGAKKMVLKAHNLFPSLENISQMLTVCSVHCAAEIKLQGSGGMDWYGILQIEAGANEASIKKQYKKLALLLHPDKNKFPGAESAFKLIGEAMRFLSDQSKRAAYDLKRNPTMTKPTNAEPGFPTKPAPQNCGTKPAQSSHNSAAGKFAGVPNNFTSQTAPQSFGTNRPHVQQHPPSTVVTTFWTMCPFCSIRYQYYGHTMNSLIRCQNCLKTFVALDINISNNFSKNQTAHSRPSYSQQNGSANPGVNFGPYKIPPTGVSRSNSFGTGSQQNISGIFIQKKTSDDAKGTEPGSSFEAQNVDGVEKPTNMEKQYGHTSETKKQTECVAESSGRGSAENEDSEEVEAVAGEPHPCSEMEAQPNTQQQCRPSRNRKHVSYNEDESNDEENASANACHAKRLKKSEPSQGAQKCKNDSAEHTKSVDAQTNPSKDPRDKKTDMTLSEEESKLNQKNVETNNGIGSESFDIGEGTHKGDCGNNEDCERSSTPQTFECPDQEFHDFDVDKTGCHFMSDQVWAVYDEGDALPRFYAIVRKVLSTDFKLRITWLESSPAHEEEQAWVDAELPIACGRYSLGKTMVTEDRLMFSHLAKGERVREGARIYYRIYPRKGEVWTLYKDWDMNWSNNPENHKQPTYELVEFLNDYADDTGALVVLLAKVHGFQSLFQRMVSKGSELLVHISGGESCRFSHQVPAHTMKGNEKEGVPRGSLELDMAALPSKFEASVPSKTFEFPESGLKNNEGDSATLDPTDYLNDLFSRPEKPVSSGAKDEHDKNDAERNEDMNCKFSKVHDVNGVSAKKLEETNAAKWPPDETAKLNTVPKVALASNHDSLSTKNIDGDKLKKHLDKDGDKNHIVLEFEHLNTLHASSLGANVYSFSSPKVHDFAKDRCIDKFRRNQIWAMYDERFDKKPRLYALIKKVDLLEHILYFTRLTVCGDLKWLSQGLPIPCGMFKSDKSDSCGPHKFSHQLRDDPTWRLGIYRIYPRQGEVWAVYTNYKLEWSWFEFERRGYSIVEVLTNYNAEKGVIIQRLSNVRGRPFLFKNSGKQEKLLSKDVLMFSHQIPSCRITDETEFNGCWELDEASLPTLGHDSQVPVVEI